jgi:hypothetical protein
MIDTKGWRCSIGRDGKLYCAFIWKGGRGDHIFQYDPFDITRKVEIVGGDEYHQKWGYAAERKAFFARYEPSTGRYLLGQQFCGRREALIANTASVECGEICGDEQGRLYIGGLAGFGLPLTFDPLHNNYPGGAWLLVMNRDFTRRLFCTRLTGSASFTECTHAIAARIISGTAHIAFGGYTQTPLYQEKAVQNQLKGGRDGWFAVICPADPSK